MSIEFNYYYGKEAEQFSFFKIPKLLFTDVAFKILSSDAKVLYGILLDRMSLSMKNTWLDAENKVYIIFTINEISEVMGCGSQKATKVLQELDSKKGIGLIEKKRLGLGKPNIIYVKNFIIKTETTNQELLKSQYQNSENHNSRVMKITTQELLKSQSNKTNINNTEYNNTSTLSPQDESEKLENNKSKNEMAEEVKKIIKSNIDYDDLLKISPDNEPLLDAVVSVMSEVIKNKKAVKINKKLCDYQDVKTMFLSIRKNHIIYIIDYLSQSNLKITNLRAYLISLIYNAPLNAIGVNKIQSNHHVNDYYKNDQEVWQNFLNGS